MSSKNDGPVLVYFHPARIALSIEVKKHSALCEQLNQYMAENPGSEFSDHIGVIAAYCNIIMDGLYSQEDLDLLANALTMKLRDKRSVIIH